MEQNSCPICNSMDNSITKFKSTFSVAMLDGLQFSSRALPQNLHHTFYECTACQILFQTVTEPEIKQMYEMQEIGDYDSKAEAVLASKTYIRHLKSLNLPFHKKGNALDIGTGEGSFLEELLDFGFQNVCGVEPATEPINCASDKIKKCIKKALFSKELFKTEKFDLISLFQAVEHVLDPVTVCRDVYAITENHGYFFLVFHDYQSIYNKIMGKKSPIVDLGHFQIFSKKSIKLLLKKSGFKHIKTFAVKNKYPISYWFKILPLPEKMKLRILPHLEKSRVGKICISISGSNCGAITQKDNLGK